MYYLRSIRHVTAYVCCLGWFENVSETMRKRAFGHICGQRRAQISLRIRAVWSGPPLSANRIMGYYRLCEWRAKARMILFACAEWYECALCACSKALFLMACRIYLWSEYFCQLLEQTFAASWSTSMRFRKVRGHFNEVIQHIFVTSEAIGMKFLMFYDVWGDSDEMPKHVFVESEAI